MHSPHNQLINRFLKRRKVHALVGPGVAGLSPTVYPSVHVNTYRVSIYFLEQIVKGISHSPIRPVEGIQNSEAKRSFL